MNNRSRWRLIILLILLRIIIIGGLVATVMAYTLLFAACLA